MKGISIKIFCIAVFLMLIMKNNFMAGQTITFKEKSNKGDSLYIHEGIVCKKAQRIKYKRNGKTLGTIQLTAPVMVAQAEKEEPWGFFQFPNIAIADDGTLIVSWQMAEDSHKGYGISSGREMRPMMSKDNGLTWVPQDKGYKTSSIGYHVEMRDGRKLVIRTPASKDIRTFITFPHPVYKIGSYVFYPSDSLPEELQGVYLTCYQAGHKAENIHAKLFDPRELRYAIGNLMPIVWWGNIKEMADKSLVAGNYPGFYQDSTGVVNPSGASFYKSYDFGHSWEIIGKIPFPNEFKRKGNEIYGFSEPTFEILSDSTFICVMRSGDTSPMYKSFSYDKGVTWTYPELFAPNGVKPQLLLLKNGILVLASGRPGVQLRFSFDGTGRKWSEPIDMMPFMNIDGTFNRNVSCGYSSIIDNGNDSFYIAWSDFTTKNVKGETRKSIWCRRVTVYKN